MAPETLARTAAMAGRTTGKNFILALFPSLSLLSTELSHAKTLSRQKQFCSPRNPKL
jgi:hypothetical protein